MKESVWYHAGYDYLFVHVAHNRIQLGCQKRHTIIFNGEKISVPDWLNLFTWEVDLKKWKEHKKNGWLVKLGDL